MVTAEIAVALPSLVLITAVALWGLALASVQLTCTDAARTGARAAARGESLDAVRDLVVKAVPAGSTVRVTRNQATVRVDVSTPVKPPAAAGLATLTVHAHAVAAAEPGTEPEVNEDAPPTTPPNPVHPTAQTPRSHGRSPPQATARTPRSHGVSPLRAITRTSHSQRVRPTQAIERISHGPDERSPPSQSHNTPRFTQIRLTPDT